MRSLHSVLWIRGVYEPEQLSFCNCNFGEFESFCKARGLSLEPDSKPERSEWVSWFLVGPEREGFPSSRMTTVIRDAFGASGPCPDCAPPGRSEA
jgi:hypothetical protein